MKAGSSCLVSVCKARGKRQALGKQARRGKSLDDEQVSEGTTTKTGGGGPFALLQERGVGRRGYPERPAHPLSLLFYDRTQSRSPEGNPRCNSPNCLRRCLGGMEPNRSSAGGEQVGLW